MLIILSVIDSFSSAVWEKEHIWVFIDTVYQTQYVEYKINVFSLKRKLESRTLFLSLMRCNKYVCNIISVSVKKTPSQLVNDL